MVVESRLGRVRKSGAVLLNDNLYFALRWLQNPLRIGAILPSGKELSAALASAVPRDGNGMVVQRHLEVANVNMIEEMIDMMIAHRVFSYTTKTVVDGGQMVKEAMDIPK